MLFSILIKASLYSEVLPMLVKWHAKKQIISPKDVRRVTLMKILALRSQVCQSREVQSIYPSLHGNLHLSMRIEQADINNHTGLRCYWSAPFRVST